VRRYYVALAITAVLAVLLFVQALTDSWLAGAVIVALVLGGSVALIVFRDGFPTSSTVASSSLFGSSSGVWSVP
jgi:uncharacterized membrane protein